MGGVIDKPAALREMARTFHAHRLYTETNELGYMAVLLLLRMHYMAVYEKRYTTTADVGTLLQRLLQRNVLTEDQWQFADGLLAEADKLADFRRAKVTMQLADYLFELLQRS